MFRALSIILVIIVAAIATRCLLFGRGRMNEIFGKDRPMRFLDPFRIIIYLISLLLIEQKANFAGILRKLFFLLAGFCFVVLFVTGFWPVIIQGKSISGLLMIIHATFAPIFAACLAALAVMWAHNARLNRNYWPSLQQLLHTDSASQEPAPKTELFGKICFWLILILALPLILSIVLGMFPVFGISGQKFLLHMHRGTASLFTVVVIVYTYLQIQNLLNNSKKG